MAEQLLFNATHAAKVLDISQSTFNRDRLLLFRLDELASHLNIKINGGGRV